MSTWAHITQVFPWHHGAMASPRLLVTGSHGLVGREVVARAQRGDYEVHGLDRHTDVLPGQVTQHSCDLLSGDLDEVVAQVRPDVVIHLAAQVSVIASLNDPVTDYRTNADGTARLAHAAGQSGARAFVYANSGGAIYDSDAAQPFHEDAPTRPQSPYGTSKLAGEGAAREVAAEFGMTFASLALANVYGMHVQSSHQPDGVIMRWLRAAAAGVTAELRDPEATRDFVHVSDVADAFLTAAARNETIDRINIGSGTATSLRQLADLISEITHHRFSYTTTALVPGEIAHSTLDITRARDVLGWQPRVSLREGIEQMWHTLQTGESASS